MTKRPGTLAQVAEVTATEVTSGNCVELADASTRAARSVGKSAEVSSPTVDLCEFADGQSRFEWSNRCVKANTRTDIGLRHVSAHRHRPKQVRIKASSDL